jgi:hypothetical protein
LEDGCSYRVPNTIKGEEDERLCEGGFKTEFKGLTRDFNLNQTRRGGAVRLI